MKTINTNQILAVVLATAMALPVAVFAPGMASASVLYGVTGDGGDPAETLFILDQNDATETEVLELGNGNDGEAIGFNPTDGLIYHASGHDGSDVIFESINSTFTGTTDIPITGTDLENEEAQALTWSSSLGEFLWKQDHGTGPLFSVTTAGIATLIGDMDHQAKGLAFVDDILYSVASQDGILRTINPDDAITLTEVAITLDGDTVQGATGLATRPEDNLLFAILKLGGGVRHLATLGSDGVATSVGELSTGFAGLAFTTAVVPVPAAVWLFGTALIGLFGFSKKRKTA